MRWALLLVLSYALYGEPALVKYAGVPKDSSLSVAVANSGLLNETLGALLPGDELVFAPNTTYYLMGGVTASNLRDVVLRFEGTLVFLSDVDAWPRDANGRVLECMQFFNLRNVTFTSSTVGLLDGQGETWWGLIGYIEYGENRPRLLSIGNSKNLLIENMYFKNSPYWTVWIYDVDGLEIRHSEVSNRRDDYDGHDFYNLSAFNTDGFDVTGRNVWIHDCTIWNQDDCIAVKDGSENMLFERINASGLGLVIGSIGGSVVRNITFRDSVMHRTYKGIYLKFRGTGLIQDILYENIFMDRPEQWAIWIGPAQQADSVDICAAHPCSLCWPEIPFAECNMPANARYVNITLRNITVLQPEAQSPGVIYGGADAPMENVKFDRVIVKTAPGAEYFVCKNVASGVATGGTFPVPSCFSTAISTSSF